MTVSNPVNNVLAKQPGLPDLASGSDEVANAGDKALSSDFETFLRMLTVQLQNQDPLNPVEASDYAVQLATFSGVEQQVRTNELLGGLGEQFQMFGLSQFAGWVGMEALHNGHVVFDGNPVEIETPIPTGWDAAQLIAKDDSGIELARFTLPDLTGKYSWNGVGDDGVSIPNTAVSLSIEGFSQGNPAEEIPASTFGVVVQAQFLNDEPILTMASGSKVSPDQVLGLRE